MAIEKILICMPLEHCTIAAITVRCLKCNALLGASPASAKAVGDVPHLFVCLECAPSVVPPQGKLHITEEQIQELEDYPAVHALARLIQEATRTPAPAQTPEPPPTPA